MRVFRALCSRFSRGAALGGLLLSGLAAIVSCGDPDKASVRLNVIFPSPALAIASDEIKFIVYDDPNIGACDRIYLKHISKQTDLPKTIFESAPVPMCDVALSRMAPFDLPVGKHSILAVALRAREDLLVGCSDVAVSADGGEVAVHLALPGNTPVPTPLSACLSVRDSCEKRCP